MNFPHWPLLMLFTLLAIAFKSEDAPKKATQDLALPQVPLAEKKAQNLINAAGRNIVTRFNLPDGFQRVDVVQRSFAHYLRYLPLKPVGAKVKYYNGTFKENHDVYASVVDMDIGTRDLQQCADAIMRLRAEYFWQKGAYEDIHFNFTNGFRVDYSKWRAGYKVRIKGNQTTWYKARASATTYKDFRAYMDLIFAYAGTLSLSKELPKVAFETMQIGDIFIQGGSPGHAIIVVDMAINPTTGKQLFLLAQSYMPAQDIQILQNPMNDTFGPWYSNQFFGDLITPEWRFERTDLKRFK